MPQHPKIAGLSDKAFRLYIAGLCYASEYLTDGTIPLAAARRLDGWSPRTVAELRAAGLWSEHPDGSLQVQNYLRWQRSRAQVEHQRALKAERQGRWRQGGGHAADGHSDGNVDPHVDASTDASRDAHVDAAPKQQHLQSRSKADTRAAATASSTTRSESHDERPGWVEAYRTAWNSRLPHPPFPLATDRDVREATARFTPETFTSIVQLTGTSFWVVKSDGKPISLRNLLDEPIKLERLLNLNYAGSNVSWSCASCGVAHPALDNCPAECEDCHQRHAQDPPCRDRRLRLEREAAEVERLALETANRAQLEQDALVAGVSVEELRSRCEAADKASRKEMFTRLKAQLIGQPGAMERAS
jgi:hypothetical protein